MNPDLSSTATTDIQFVSTRLVSRQHVVGTLLTLKICLALSILGHFILVVLLMRSGRMTPARSRLIHLSVLVQMLAILFLAKAMFLLSW